MKQRMKQGTVLCFCKKLVADFLISIVGSIRGGREERELLIISGRPKNLSAMSDHGNKSYPDNPFRFNLPFHLFYFH